MYLRRSYTQPERLVLDTYDFSIYFKIDPLIKTFLDGEVPVGILIDYIEDNTAVIEDTLGAYKLSYPEIINHLRANFKDSTALYQHPRLMSTTL